jgi:two-component system OmpR family sensor kinase
VSLIAEGAYAVIAVTDHGPGVPADQRLRIFERFHRANPDMSGDRGGSGLGLSIVDAVVAAHGGTVQVIDTPGGGATFRVRLPLNSVIETAKEPSPPLAASRQPA